MVYPLFESPYVMDITKEDSSYRGSNYYDLKVIRNFRKLELGIV